MKNLIKRLNIGKRIIVCPRCKKRLRIPIKKGKPIRITCPQCSTLFDVSFINPFTEVFQWKKSLGIIHNLKNIKLNFKKLPAKDKKILNKRYKDFLENISLYIDAGYVIRWDKKKGKEKIQENVKFSDVMNDKTSYV